MPNKGNGLSNVPTSTARIRRIQHGAASVGVCINSSYNSENSAYQVPASVPLPPSSRPILLASSHKGWLTKPPIEFPPYSVAPFAVFPEEDALSLGNGISLIYGGEPYVFLLQQESVSQIRRQPEIQSIHIAP